MYERAISLIMTCFPNSLQEFLATGGKYLEEGFGGGVDLAALMPET